VAKCLQCLHLIDLIDADDAVSLVKRPLDPHDLALLLPEYLERPVCKSEGVSAVWLVQSAAILETPPKIPLTTLLTFQHS
jgi:hypothetical protein